MTTPTFTLRCVLPDVLGRPVTHARINIASTADTSAIAYPGELRPVGSTHDVPGGVRDFVLPLTTNSAANPTTHQWVITGKAMVEATGAIPFGPIYVERATSGTVNLADFVNAPPTPPTWRDDFRAEMETIRDDAVAITGLPGADAAWAASIPTSSGSATSAAITTRLAPYSTTAQVGTAISAALATAPTWTPYTPNLTGIALGNGTQTGGFATYPGGLVAFHVEVTFGSTTTLTGGVSAASLPVAAAHMLGSSVHATNPGDSVYALYGLLSAGVVEIYIPGVNGRLANWPSATVPFTWGAGDSLTIQGIYRKA